MPIKVCDQTDDLERATSKVSERDLFEYFYNALTDKGSITPKLYSLRQPNTIVVLRIPTLHLAPSLDSLRLEIHPYIALFCGFPDLQ
jgi:hypothetical protein